MPEPIAVFRRGLHNLHGSRGADRRISLSFRTSYRTNCICTRRLAFNNSNLSTILSDYMTVPNGLTSRPLRRLMSYEIAIHCPSGTAVEPGWPGSGVSRPARLALPAVLHCPPRGGAGVECLAEGDGQLGPYLVQREHNELAGRYFFFLTGGRRTGVGAAAGSPVTFLRSTTNLRL